MDANATGSTGQGPTDEQLDAVRRVIADELGAAVRRLLGQGVDPEVLAESLDARAAKLRERLGE